MVEYLKMTFVQLSGPHLKSHCYGVIRMGWDRIMPKTLQVPGERLLLLLDRTGLGLLLHHLLILRGLALLRIHLLHWARLGLQCMLVN